MKFEIMRKIFVLSTVFLLIGFFQIGSNIQAEENEQTITHYLTIEDYSIEQTTDGDKLSVENFGRLLIEGKPNLPSKIISIAIPPGSSIKNIEIHAQKSMMLNGFYQIPPCPSPRIIGGETDDENADEYQSNYLETYSSDEPYPSQIGEFVQKSNYRKYEMVDLRINPFTYYPLSEKLEFHQKISISITYIDPSDSTKGIQDDLKTTEQYAEKIILNYHQAQQWYQSIEEENKEIYDYVIITLDSLTSSLDSLVDWETTKGRNVNVVTTSWIDSNYDGYDLQEKMRNFLREKYPSSEWGIEYVLLAGHYDDVPMRRCAQDTGYGQPETDYYYAELSLPDEESWDANENHQYGESSDSIDFYAEVSVGRIPWSDPSIVESICEKTVSYEQNDDPGFKKNILLLGAFFWDDTDNAELMEEIASNSWMNDWTMTRMYEEAQSSYPVDFDLNYANVESDWSSNTYGFVNWAGHGSPTSAHEYYPSSAPIFVDNDVCTSLNDDYPAIIFADACSNHDTDHLNLGQAMMQQGGVGYLGATKVAYGHPGWNSPYDGSSQSLDYFFTSKVTSGEYSTGDAHQWALTEMYTNGLWNYNYYETFEWGAYLGNPDMYMFLPAIEFDFPNGLPDLIDPNVPTTIEVQINEIGDTYVDGSGLLHYRFDDGTFQSVSLTHINDNLYEAILPSASCGDSPEFYFSAETSSSGIITSPSNAPSSVYDCLVGEFTELFSDDFETDTGWTVEDSPDLTEGSWERGIPIDDNRGDPPSDYDGSGQCYVTGNSDDEDIDDGTTWLISPVFDVSESLDAMISYALWYTNDFGSDPNNDLFKTYVSNDAGDNWVLAETIGPGSLSGWVEQSFMIGDIVSPTDQVQIRFEASDLNDGSVVEAAIDAVQVSLFDCSPPGPILTLPISSYNFENMNEGELDSTSFEICNDGVGLLNYSASESEDWLDVTPLSGSVGSSDCDTVTVNVDTTGLSNGSYHAEVVMDSNGGSDVFDVFVYVGIGEEMIDVNQSVQDRPFLVRHASDGDWGGAQGFVPSVGVLSRVELLMKTLGTPSFDLTVELREGSVDGVLLDSITMSAEDFSSDWEWIEFDFVDVSVAMGTEYVIVLNPPPSGVSNTFGYGWGYALDDVYDDGSLWFTRTSGSFWLDLPDLFDYTFRTYGYI